ncbi:YdeI/OmpD-associated family protein [Marixanthomonas sp. SCSIO 43207]|uniref:YdeI/OmpD-associated family protein n=1 Tax=Marixanthomonas sp. SCSIO 43207 TaxID=2779360 RepID=UPI001CA8AB49|nr:DUF1801 domain-containing protein [Marixanthomonas sp. SCSIO 43207]UAB80825.1 YdeI/OmpD-associated family protein [Marixanthomonas sp. SCSIO 43207]
MDKRVKAYLSRAKQWKEEMKMLREIIIDCDVEEDFKWMHPCYTNKGKNIVLIHGFKEYCALLFHKGALLKDSQGVLIQQTKNTQVARQLRFASVTEIEKQKHIIKDYINEAIKNEQEGKEVALKKNSDYEKPDELLAAFKEDSDFEKAFNSLTPGRQRGYLLHFTSAKQSKTRVSRIEKAKHKIFDGKGYNER